VSKYPHFATFKGADSQWYWRLVAANGKVMAVGGEGFTSRAAARRAVARVRTVATTALIQVDA
jgi:uncharacterized protein YegP (UPF0339 family)